MSARIGAKYPVIQTAEPLGILTTEPALHTVTPDGRVQHLFEKVDGIWTCVCGEQRDRFGKAI